MLKSIQKSFISLTKGIKNIIKWFPTIYGDRDYDSFFFFVIMRKKLIEMEKLFREYGHHVDSKEDADKMKVCINLLDRLIADEYEENEYKKIDEKLGEIDLNFKPITDRPGVYSCDVSRSGIKTEEDKEKEMKEFKEASQKAVAMKNQDKEMLFKLLNKHILTWWD
jgi:hypothetical protein